MPKTLTEVDSIGFSFVCRSSGDTALTYLTDRVIDIFHSDDVVVRNIIFVLTGRYG